MRGGRRHRASSSGALFFTLLIALPSGRSCTKATSSHEHFLEAFVSWLREGRAIWNPYDN
jgi:hypothetical protein